MRSSSVLVRTAAPGSTPAWPTASLGGAGRVPKQVSARIAWRYPSREYPLTLSVFGIARAACVSSAMWRRIVRDGGLGRRHHDRSNPEPPNWGAMACTGPAPARVKPGPVPRALIEEIIGLATRAPSSMNTQPWNFYIITGEPLDRIRAGNTERMMAGVPQSREFRTPQPVLGKHRDRQVGVAKRLCPNASLSMRLRCLSVSTMRRDGADSMGRTDC